MLQITPSQDAWFNNNRVAFVVPQDSNPDRISVMEMTLPPDEAPPLHVHHAEDEIFHILDGEIRYRVGEATIVKRTGDTLLAPRGVPHGFRVLSPEGARVLIITRGGFEDMVRSVSRPVTRPGLPDQVEPTHEMQVRLTAECAVRQIEILGPPIE